MLEGVWERENYTKEKVYNNCTYSTPRKYYNTAIEDRIQIKTKYKLVVMSIKKTAYIYAVFIV